MNEEHEPHAKAVEDVINVIYDMINDYDMTMGQVDMFVFSIICSVAGLTDDPDDFMKYQRKYIDEALDSPQFDQIMTDFTNSE